MSGKRTLTIEGISAKEGIEALLMGDNVYGEGSFNVHSVEGAEDENNSSLEISNTLTADSAIVEITPAGAIIADDTGLALLEELLALEYEVCKDSIFRLRKT